ncbi:MAG: hypothetical protein JKP90_16955 [Desulfofustis sp. PB-SRB1]|nr:hypothetical protein [Desulfofustis sp. PB-SRB1]
MESISKKLSDGWLRDALRSQKSEQKTKTAVKEKKKGLSVADKKLLAGGTEVRRQRTEVRKDRVRKC